MGAQSFQVCQEACRFESEQADQADRILLIVPLACLFGAHAKEPGTRRPQPCGKESYLIHSTDLARDVFETMIRREIRRGSSTDLACAAQ